MKITNILITGVGGQGLVVSTKILSEVAFKEGYDIKTSDVIGLSQRGGMVWGSVRFGKKVFSSLIPEGEVDMLLAMEELEGIRWIKALRPGGSIILNRESIYPNRVLIEKDVYPEKIEASLMNSGFNLQLVEAKAISKQLGNIKVANIVLLGKLSTLLPFSEHTWIGIISVNVPRSTIDINIAAFNKGRNI